MGKGTQLLESDYLSENMLFVYFLRRAKVNYCDIAKMLFVADFRAKDVFASAKGKVKKAAKLGVSEPDFIKQSCERRGVESLSDIHKNRLAKALELERRKQDLEAKFNKLEQERVMQIASMDNVLTALGMTTIGGVVYLTEAQAQILHKIANREFEDLVYKSQKEVDDWRNQLIRLHSNIQCLRIDPTEKLSTEPQQDF